MWHVKKLKTHGERSDKKILWFHAKFFLCYIISKSNDICINFMNLRIYQRNYKWYGCMTSRKLELELAICFIRSWNLESVHRIWNIRFEINNFLSFFKSISQYHNLHKRSQVFKHTKTTIYFNQGCGKFPNLQLLLWLNSDQKFWLLHPLIDYKSPPPNHQ